MACDDESMRVDIQRRVNEGPAATTSAHSSAGPQKGRAVIVSSKGSGFPVWGTDTHQGPDVVMLAGMGHLDEALNASADVPGMVHAVARTMVEMVLRCWPGTPDSPGCFALGAVSVSVTQGSRCALSWYMDTA